MNLSEAQGINCIIKRFITLLTLHPLSIIPLSPQILKAWTHIYDNKHWKLLWWDFCLLCFLPLFPLSQWKWKSFTNILLSVSLILPISLSQILHPRGFNLFWALKRMMSMWHMSSLQNLTKSVLKVAKMRSGRKLLGKNMFLNVNTSPILQQDIQCQNVG